MSEQSGKAEPRKQATVEVIARITDADGNVVERKITVSNGFPSSDDFDLSTRDGFLRDFDAMEKAGLEAQEAIPGVFTEYLKAVSEKQSDQEKGKS